MRWVCEESLKNPLLATHFILFWIQKQAFTHYWHLHGPSLAQQINCDKILFSHTRRWYKFLFLNYFFIFLFFSFFVILCYFVIISFYKNFFIIIILFFLFFMKIIFIFSCSGIFRDVPVCSVFRVACEQALLFGQAKRASRDPFHSPKQESLLAGYVPGFIDALCSRKIDDFRKNFDLSWHCVGRLTRPERNLRNLFRGHGLKYINCSNKSIIYIGFLMNNNSKNILFRYYVC